MTDLNETNMLKEAREAQWSSQTFMGKNTIKIVAPAKVNLFLDVLDRRTDGYHNVINVMHALSLHDVLYMSSFDDDDPCKADLLSSYEFIRGPLSGIPIAIDMAIKDITTGFDIAPHFPTDIQNDPSSNLAFKAIDQLAFALGFSSAKNDRSPILVRIEKHIPSQAGLGGGSSDAAAALIGAMDLWGISSDDPAIAETAAEVAHSLGADVAFFLHGGCALFDGIGSTFSRRLTPMKRPVVIVKTAEGISTPDVYAAFDINPIEIAPELANEALSSTDAESVPLANNLSTAAFQVVPELARVHEWLESADGIRTAGHIPQISLSGSGSASFAICETYSDALRLAACAGALGWWARATTFSGLSASIVRG